MTTEEPTTEAENTKPKDSSEPGTADEQKDTVKKNGRFKSVRVREEGGIPPSQSSASLISSICSQLNEYNYVEHVLPDPHVACEKNPQSNEKDPQPIETPLTFTAKSGQRLFEQRPKNGRLPENTVPPSTYNTSQDKDKENKNTGFLQKIRNFILSILRNPKAFGFQHICLLVLVLAYTLLGATLFFFIESSYEHKMVRIRKAALDTTIRNIAEEMTSTVNDPNKTVDVETMVDYLQRTYITLLKQESAYKDSTFYKAEDGKNLKWTFGSSFFFSMNVFTTTGYGSIAPESTLGKICVIIYGFIFVPLTLVVIRHLGNWTLLIVTNVYAKGVIRWRKFRSRSAIEDGEIFTLPVILCMLIMLVYLMGTTTFIYVYDMLSGPSGSGIDYFLSFYFSFISISTIGLGDVMPNNVTFDPVITILFFFGMPLMKVVNSSTYQSVEKATIGILSLMENRLSTLGQGSKVADVSAGVTAGSFALAQAIVPNIDVFQPPKSRAITLTDLNTGPQLQEENGNDITIRSVLTFIKSDAHVYGGRFGRVDLEAKMSPR